MIISIASGKGGTGKTLVAVNMALSLAGIGARVQLVDCDVEEPNDYIFLQPTTTSTEEAVMIVPRIDETKCTYCRLCAEVCSFKAITVFLKTALVFSEMCHGCGACSYLCPEGAITEEERPVGTIEVGIAYPNTPYGVELVYGSLNVAESLVPPMIRQVKKHITPERTVILDAPPGTSCPAVETVKGSDFCLLVAEPTPFGLHDLELAAEMAGQMKIPFGVALNRAGAGDETVVDFCRRRSLPLLLTIPFDLEIAGLYSRGIPLVEARPEWRGRFCDLFEEIGNYVRGRS